MSRLRSARAASSPARPAAAARAGGRPGVFVQTPRSDIYVVMLGIALGAILIGVLLLVLVLRRYDFSTKPTAMAPAPTTALAALENFSTVRL